jgi:hypothetical protein
MQDMLLDFGSPVVLVRDLGGSILDPMAQKLIGQYVLGIITYVELVNRMAQYYDQAEVLERSN